MTELLVPGCKTWVHKEIDGETTYKEAEVISVREGKDKDLEFYVHYIDFNKRLDEWIKVDVIDLSRIEPPKPSKKKAPLTDSHSKQQQGKDSTPKQLFGIHKKRAQQQNAAQQGPTAQNSSTNAKLKDPSNYSNSSTNPNPSTKQSLTPEMEMLEEFQNFATEYTKNSLAPLQTCSKQQEIENLRRGGSMTQRSEEISRVRNIAQIEMGKHRVNTWYFSPYPESICNDQGILYICEFCLLYHGSRTALRRHLQKCAWRHPPGHEIYRKDSISFFEIDGHKQKTFCRNLCLLSKLFLDHKTLYYDVDPFLFYLLTENDAHGCHLLGYFSKEKESAEGYNLACILTLPQHQRKGWGKVLISFSYELAKRTGHIGSPEKPLSDLGLISYRSYWADAILSVISEHSGDISIEELSAMTCITCEDILHTIQALDLLCYFRGQHIMLLSEKILADMQRQGKRRSVVIDPSFLKWTPPVFTLHQLRYL